MQKRIETLQKVALEGGGDTKTREQQAVNELQNLFVNSLDRIKGKMKYANTSAGCNSFKWILFNWNTPTVMVDTSVGDKLQFVWTQGKYYERNNRFIWS